MSLTIDWLHFITLLGAIQGVILAGALASKRTNRTANRLLAVLMISFSIYLASSVYHAGGYEERFPHFIGLGYQMVFLFGPLVYLYAVAAADRTHRLTRRDTVHFSLFAVSIALAIPFLFSSGAEKLEFLAQLRAGNVPLSMRIMDPLKMVWGVGYAIATLVFVRRHSEQVKATYSSTESVNLQWLVWLGAGAAFIWVMAVAFELLQSAGIMHARRSDDIIALAIAILVYGIGYKGLKQPEIFRYQTAEFPISRMAYLTADRTAGATANPGVDFTANQRTDLTAYLDADVKTDEATSEATGPRYERSGLTERQAQRLRELLLTMMERERPWQNSELTLVDLATRLHTTPHKLSEVLNSQVGQTFYDFVNGYRVREVQRRIAAGEAKRVKMLPLALDAGFASKSTFNLVFKKLTSQTPSDYRAAAGA